MIIFDIPLYFKRYLYQIDSKEVEKINDGIKSMFYSKINTNKGKKTLQFTKLICYLAPCFGSGAVWIHGLNLN